MSGQAWNAAWYGWFDGSSPTSSGAGVSMPASSRVCDALLHRRLLEAGLVRAVAAAGQRALEDRRVGGRRARGEGAARGDVEEQELRAVGRVVGHVLVGQSWRRWRRRARSCRRRRPRSAAAMVCTSVCSADRVVGGRVHDRRSRPARSRARRARAATVSSSCAWSRAAANTATLPSSSPCVGERRSTASGWSVSGVQVTHGALACSSRSGVISPPTTAVAWVVDRAEHRVGEEEADDDEHVLVLGQLDALRLGRRRAGRVDRGEDRLELAAVDAAVGVDVVEQRLVHGLVVAEVVVEARPPPAPRCRRRSRRS